MDKIKNFIVNFIHAEKAVQVRTIALVIAIINLILYLVGKNSLPVTAEQVWGYLSTILMIVTAIPAWWKNNSITEEAKKADEFLEKLREVTDAIDDYDKGDEE